MIFSMNLSHYPSTSDNLNLMATQQSRSTTKDGDDDWQAQHPIQAYPDIDTYPAQQQQQPINWGLRSGTAMNSAIIWDFLMAQVRVQLRNMSPDECFSRAVELHMLARSEVGMRRENLFNDIEPVAIGQQSIVQSTASGTGTRSHNQPFAAAATTTISSFVSISPMRVHANNTSNSNNITYPTQQQFHFGERQIMTSPMSNPYTMNHGMAYPQASPRQYQYQAEEDVSSTPGYMRDRFLMAADIHPTAQQLHFNESQVLPSSPMASPIPNQFHHDEGMPPLPTSSAKDAETPNLFEETTPNQADPNMQDDSVLDMNMDPLVQDDDMPAASKGNPSSKKTKVASKWSEVPFKAKKTLSKPPKRRCSTRKKKLVSCRDSQASKSKADTTIKVTKKVASKPVPPKQTKKKILTGTRIIAPSDKDVICGRGGHSNNHVGNVRFRDEARQMRGVYQEASKFGKQESRASKRAISMVSNS